MKSKKGTADIAAESLRQTSAIKISTSKVDKHGRSFDPEIHEVHSDGTPVVNKVAGTLRIKRGVQKKPDKKASIINIPGETSKPLPGGGDHGDPAAGSPPGASPQGDDFSPEPPGEPGPVINATGLTMATGYFSLGQMLLTKNNPGEWKPTDEQHLRLAVSYSKFAQAKGIDDLSPTADVIINTAYDFLGRYGSGEETQQTVNGWMLTGANLINGIWYKFNGKPLFVPTDPAADQGNQDD